MSTPILIVGAGPTGLTLALSLVQNGASVRVVEKRSSPFIGQRGGGIMPRTLELHGVIGTLPDILKIAGPPLTTELYLPQAREPSKVFDMAPYIEPTADRPYPNPVILWQSRHEAILRDHLQKAGVEVEWETEMQDFEQHQDCVTVTLKKKLQGIDGDHVMETVTTPYLLSAEGAHSMVRKRLNLGFYGETTSQSYIIGDIEVLEGLNRDRWFFCGEPMTKQISLCAGEDLTSKYMYMLYTGAEVDHKKVAASREALIEDIYELTGRREIKFGNLLWISSYTPNIRTVEKYSQGRCFVAGDAAHIFALSGAQGLNSGIHDAINLGWKMAAVVRGFAPPSLLDSYGPERLPVIAEMLDKTREVHEKTFKSSIADEDNDAWNRGGDFDMLHMNYRGSSLVIDTIHTKGTRYTFSTGITVRAGDRAPDAPGLVHRKGTGGPTSLFKIFGSSYHTVLIFSKDQALSSLVIASLQEYPSELFKTVVVLPKTQSKVDFNSAQTDFVVEDSNEHAYDAYVEQNCVRESTIVIVRPDTYIGAMVDKEEDVRRYFSQIFKVTK
ncbi:Flavin-dependent monooxygenase [Psilocybe cubensis]|uniref:Flavin-dependent monooxygenase n=2 Tax=Psilocybe cubensis TaxID=181762 RepID=A0ACB8HI12_PSICU|nr:Flavin-dependent monooxygenase [Psilocybe cubensis]KAH9487377.1 Flavin-dependent monooxygenase [Psilocybe cubensis]